MIASAVLDIIEMTGKVQQTSGDWQVDTFFSIPALESRKEQFAFLGVKISTYSLFRYREI